MIDASDVIYFTGLSRRLAHGNRPQDMNPALLINHKKSEARIDKWMIQARTGFNGLSVALNYHIENTLRKNANEREAHRLALADFEFLRSRL